MFDEAGRLQHYSASLAFSPELAAMIYQLPKIEEKLAAQVFVPNQHVG